jgi:hypothetical protein
VRVQRLAVTHAPTVATTTLRTGRRAASGHRDPPRKPWSGTGHAAFTDW